MCVRALQVFAVAVLLFLAACRVWHLSLVFDSLDSCPLGKRKSAQSYVHVAVDPKWIMHIY